MQSEAKAYQVAERSWTRRSVYFLFMPRASWADWAALPRVSEAESRTDWPCLEASLLVPETVSEAFWPTPFSPEGWTEPATLSAVFLMESPAFSVADFWESGFMAEAALSVVLWRLERMLVVCCSHGMSG
jgi:hypothetical protein